MEIRHYLNDLIYLKRESDNQETIIKNLYQDHFSHPAPLKVYDTVNELLQAGVIEPTLSCYCKFSEYRTQMAMINRLIGENEDDNKGK